MRELGIAIPAPKAPGSCAVSALVAITCKSKKEVLDGLRKFQPEACRPTNPGTMVTAVDSFLAKEKYEVKAYKDPFASYPGKTIPLLPPGTEYLEKAIEFVGERKAIVSLETQLFGKTQCHAVAVGNGLICDNAFAVPSPYKIWKNAIPYRIGRVVHISLIEQEPS